MRRARRGRWVWLGAIACVGSIASRDVVRAQGLHGTEEAQESLAASAAPDAEPPTAHAFEGPLLSRTQLTGNWGGGRTWLAEHGIAFDLNITQVTQGVVSNALGGRVFDLLAPDSDKWGGQATFELIGHLDTEKAGLWPGGFATVRVAQRVGSAPLARAGTISPININAIYPVARFNQDILDVTELSLIQFLSPKVGVVAGLLNTLGGDQNFFASGRGQTQFLNAAMVFNLAPILFVPLKTLGAGIIALPTGNPEDMQFTFTVMSSTDSSGHNPFDHFDGVTVTSEFYLGHELFGKRGRQTLGFGLGHKSFRDLDGRILLPPRLVGEKDNAWAFYYNGAQYLWTDPSDETRGAGLFARLGVSDGNPSPIRGVISAGLGGNPPWRWADGIGAGFYYLFLSDENLIDRAGIDDEVGFEAFYRFAVTPWLSLSADVQVVGAGLGRDRTPTIVGLRTFIAL